MSYILTCIFLMSSSNGPTTTPLTTRGFGPMVASLSRQVQNSFGIIGEGLSDGKISWILGSQGLGNPPPPCTNKKSNTLMFQKKGKTPKKRNPPQRGQ